MSEQTTNSDSAIAIVEKFIPNASAVQKNAMAMDIIAAIHRGEKEVAETVQSVTAEIYADFTKRIVAALREMTETFQPFKSKPMGAPHSEARLDQERKIEVHERAVATLRQFGGAKP